MNTPRALRIISSWPSPNDGISRYAAAFANGFRQRGTQVTTERVFFWREKSRLMRWIGIWRKVAADRVPVLVQHTPTVSGPLLPWFLARCRLHGIRAVLECHETPSTYARHLRGIPGARAAYLAWEAASTRNARFTVVHTTLHHDELAALGCGSIVLPHPILEEPSLPAPSLDGPILCYGQISRKKGHDLLIDAIQSRPSGSFPPLHIWGVPGARQEGWTNALKDRILPSHRDSIVFCGYLPDAERDRVLSTCRLAVLPYRWITQSGVLCELVARRIPFVASDLPYFREFHETWSCGRLFPAQDVQGLAQAIDVSLADPDSAGGDWERIQKELSLGLYLDRIGTLLTQES